MTRPRFRTLAHTADLRLAVWGSSDAELVRHTVLGVVRIVLGRTLAAPGERWEAVRNWPGDLPHQLVRAANEALFQLYARRRAPVGIEVGPRGARLGSARSRLSDSSTSRSRPPRSTTCIRTGAGAGCTRCSRSTFRGTPTNGATAPDCSDRLL